jgi:hypothetical protein
MRKGMRGFLEVLLGFLILVPIVLGIYWLFWCLWTWVLPQLWPHGPQAFIEPGYWLFVGMLFLVSMIGRLFWSSK